MNYMKRSYARSILSCWLIKTLKSYFPLNTAIIVSTYMNLMLQVCVANIFHISCMIRKNIDRSPSWARNISCAERSKHYRDMHPGHSYIVYVWTRWYKFVQWMCLFFRNLRGKAGKKWAVDVYQSHWHLQFCVQMNNTKILL